MIFLKNQISNVKNIILIHTIFQEIIYFRIEWKNGRNMFYKIYIYKIF